MGLFEQFPYINFHELNLDWLLYIVKKTAEMAEITDDKIDDAVRRILDQMVEDGFFDTYFADVEAELEKRLLVIDTMTQIPAGLAIGTAVQTKGWNTIGDGGDGLYIVTSSGFPRYGSYSFYLLHETRVDVRKCGIFSNDYANNRDMLQLALNNYDYIDMEPGATYLLNYPLTIHANSRIDGHGATLTSGVTDAFQLINRAAGTSDVVIENLKFVGSGNPSGLYYLMSLTDTDNITIRNCDFSKSYGYAIRVSGSTNVLIENCKFSYLNGGPSNPGGCIYMQGGSNLVIRNVQADYIQDHVVYLDGSTEVSDVQCSMISSDHITNPITNAACVVCYGNVHNVTVSDSSCDNGVIGFQCSERNGMMPRYVTFERCSVHNQSQNGFLVSDSNNTGYSVHVIIDNCDISTLQQDGIAIRGCSFVTVVDCTIKDVARYGVALSDCSNCNIERTDATGCDAGFIAGYPNMAENNTFRDCVTGNNTSYGIYNRDGKNAYINCRTGTDQRIIGAGYDVLTTRARSVDYRTATPTTGYHEPGDLVINTGSTATTGWRCTAAGTPGTWAAF